MVSGSICYVPDILWRGEFTSLFHDRAPDFAYGFTDNGGIQYDRVRRYGHNSRDGKSPRYNAGNDRGFGPL